MAFDVTRTNPVYQQPQTPDQYGTANKNQAYNVNIPQNNPGVPPTVTPIPSYGFGTQQKPQTPPAPAPAPTSNPYTDNPLAGPGYQEDWYKKYGQDLMNGPSASERLFDESFNGSNPYYDYAQQRTIKAINDASAARGNFNSSYTMRQIGDSVANLRGQQAHELDMLAGQADQGKFGRYDRSNEYAGDAQRATENRITGGINAYTGLANNQADKVGSFYGEAGRESTTADMASIEAALKKAGLTSQEAKQMMDEFGAGAGILVKLLAA